MIDSFPTAPGVRNIREWSFRQIGQKRNRDEEDGRRSTRDPHRGRSWFCMWSFFVCYAMTTSLTNATRTDLRREGAMEKLTSLDQRELTSLDQRDTTHALRGNEECCEHGQTIVNVGYSDRGTKSTVEGEGEGITLRAPSTSGTEEKDKEVAILREEVGALQEAMQSSLAGHPTDLERNFDAKIARVREELSAQISEHTRPKDDGAAGLREDLEGLVDALREDTTRKVKEFESRTDAKITEIARTLAEQISGADSVKSDLQLEINGVESNLVEKIDELGAKIEAQNTQNVQDDSGTNGQFEENIEAPSDKISSPGDENMAVVESYATDASM
eukprot:g4889.t1